MKPKKELLTVCFTVDRNGQRVDLVVDCHVYDKDEADPIRILLDNGKTPPMVWRGEFTSAELDAFGRKAWEDVEYAKDQEWRRHKGA